MLFTFLFKFVYSKIYFENAAGKKKVNPQENDPK